jgi:hypothetical protein
VLAPRPIPLFGAGAEKPLKITRRGKNYIEFDAEEYTTAYVRVRFKAKKGTSVYVTYAECRAFEEHYIDEDGDPHVRTIKKNRDDENGAVALSNSPKVKKWILFTERC